MPAGLCRLRLKRRRWPPARGEVPVGAVVVDGTNGEVLACASNRVEELGDQLAHAEMQALQEAIRVKQMPRLVDCDLYVTLEPCAMCAAAASLARIRRLYFGASDPKGGGVEHGARIFSQSTCHHAPGRLWRHRCATLGGAVAPFFRRFAADSRKLRTAGSSLSVAFRQYGHQLPGAPYLPLSVQTELPCRRRVRQIHPPKRCCGESKSLHCLKR